jgi:hypothetical protein
MSDNFSENYMIKRLEQIQNKGLYELNKIEKNYDELKDVFYELTKQYEIKKMEEEKNLDSNLNEMINQIISEEHNNSINYINNIFNKYNKNNCISSISDQANIKKMVDNIEIDLKKIISNLDNKTQNLKSEKNNNIENINIEMKNEINNVIKKINDTSLDLLVSNSDKANAIQDIIKIYLNKFKVSKSEFNEFEEKITKLISELLEKVVLLKKGQ